MKVLFLSQGRKVSDHPGWDWSLGKLKEEGSIEDYLNIPWLGYVDSGKWNEFYEKVVDLANGGGFDVIYFHCFHHRRIPSPETCLKRLRSLEPRRVIITSSGDPFSADWMLPDFPESFKMASRYADITFSTQMGRAADKMMRWGARNVVLSPLAMCPFRFKNYEIEPKRHKFDFDVVMVGSRNVARFNPLSKHYWASRTRTKLVYALDKHFGKRFGIFGYGWDGLPSAQGPVPFDQQQLAFQRGRVFVGGTPYAMTDYYMSNRPFFSIAAGIPTVELKTPRMDKILRNDDHVYFADSIEGVIRKCVELLKRDPVELYAKAAVAAREVVDRHTQYHRMKFKLDTVRRYVDNGFSLDVNFPFFLPEVDLGEELGFATRKSSK